MFVFYDILFLCFAVLYLPYMCVAGKWHAGMGTRFGKLAPMPDGEKRIWVHAVSVGEVLAIVDLIERIRRKYPGHKIVCTTVTVTGYKVAIEQLGGICAVLYAPLDFSWTVRRYIKVIKPVVHIAAETEIWPNLYTALQRAGVPIVQVNGRISDKSYGRYRLVRPLMKTVLDCVAVFCMQSEQDAERIRDLGADPARVRVAGNLKFDNMPEATVIQKGSLGFGDDEDLFIAGSTHPGEEEILIDVYRHLNARFPQLRLVIAPRHIERAGSIAELVKEKGFEPARFSQITNTPRDARSIVIVDTIGHLRSLYALAKLVFMGKSLAVGGGQNMIEPASLGKPTIVGPNTQNFKDVMCLFLAAGAIVQVKDADRLLEEARNLLADDGRAAGIGAKARRTVERYRGATDKTASAIYEVMERS